MPLSHKEVVFLCEKLEGGGILSDFRIRLQTTVEKGNVESELNSLIKTLENKKIKLGINDSDFKNQIQGIQSALNNAFKMDRSQLNNLNTLKSALKEINKLSKQANKKLFSDTGASQEAKSISTLNKKYDQLMAKKQTIEKQLSNIKVGNLSSSQAKEVDKLRESLKGLESLKIDTKDLVKSKSELTQFENKLKEVKSNLGNLKIDMNIDKQVNGAKSSVDGLITKLQTLNKTGFGNTGKINETISKLQTLKSELNNLNPNSENFTAEFQNMIQSINQCESEYKQLNSAMQSSKANFNFQTNLSRTLSELQQLRQKCVDLGQSTGQVDRLEQELRQLGNVSTDKAASGLQRIKSEMASMKSSMSGLNTAGSGVQKMFGNLYSTMSTFSLGNMLATGIQSGVHSIGATINDLDKAFVSFQKVAPESFRATKAELDSLRDKAVTIGQEVARSSVDIINSTSSALQAGFSSIDGALEYAKNVNMYANVADIDEESADRYVKSIMSAYGGVENSIKPMRTQIQGASKDYSLLNSYMDNANFIGNHYALTSADIGEALSRSASTLKSYGVGIADSMALVAGAQESIQDASKVGNALKSLSINLGGLKTSAKTGNIELNKTALALEKYAGIDVTKPGGELMDTMEILTELSDKWDEFDKQTRVGLGEAIAGKYQSNVFNSLMENFQTVKDIQQEIASGAALGSADKENARFIDSIEGRIIKLQEELKKLASTTISTDFAKNFISGLTGVVSSVNNVISSLDKLGVSAPVVLSALTGTFMTIKSLGTGTQLPNFAKTISSLATSGSSLNKIQTNLKSTSTQFTTLSAGAKKYSTSLRVASSSSEKFNNSIRTNGVVATKSANGLSVMSKTASQAKSSLSGMGSMLQGIGSTLLTTFGNMAIMAVAGIAISKITEELYKFAHASEISLQKHEENIGKINTKISELKTQKSSLKSIAKEYDELANKTSKSAEEQERYNELRNEIAELNPDLQVGTDEDGNAILSLNGSLKDYIKNLDSAIKKQRMLQQQQENAMASDASDHLQKGGNVAFGYDYKNYEKATKVAEEEKIKIEKSGSNLTNAINKFTATSERSFESSIEKIRTAREEHTAQIEESYNKVVEEQEKIDEYSSKLKQKAFNKVESNTQLEKAGDDIKSFAKNITASLDFSSLKTGQIDTYARNLSKSLASGEIDDALVKYQSLRKELETTGDTFTYQNSVQSLIPEMAKLLGVNEEIVASMVKVPPTMTQATSALDSYLQSFGKRESMKGFDIETDNLIKQYEAFNTFIDDLGNLDAQEVDGEVIFDIEAVAQIVNQNEMPKQIKDLFSQMQSDGKFTNEEMQIMTKISMAMTTTDSSERDKLLSSIQEWIDQAFPNSEIDIGELGVKAEYNFDSGQFSKELSGILKGEKSQQIRIDIEAAVQFGDLKTLQDKLKQLPEKKQVEIINSIQQAGGITPEQLKELINGLPDEVKKRISVSTPGADESNNKLNQVDENSKSKDKKVKTSAPGADETISKEKQVDKNSGNKKKKVDVSAPGGATAAQTLAQINERTYNKKQTITTVFKTIGKAVSNFFGGGYQPPVIKSAGGFSNISNTPQEASTPTTMSTGFSGISDSPTMASGTPSTQSTINPTSQVSAKAKTNPIDTIFTSSTKSTKISTSLKHVWDTIKYGVNLLQELENRIKRVANNVDLLDSKMEHATDKKKITYLEQQNKLYKEQSSLTKTLYSKLNSEKNSVYKKVKDYGFKANSQGNISNYDEQITKLEAAAAAAEKKSSNYKGKSDKTKNALEKSADKAREKLENAKKATERYMELQLTEIPSARKEWQDLQNTIKDNNNEIEKLKLNLKTLKKESGITANNYKKNDLESTLNRLNTKSENAQGIEKINILNKQNDVLKEQVALNSKNIELYKQEKKDYRDQLRKYGAKFDENGMMTNMSSVLSKYANTDDYDKVKEWVDSYADLSKAQDDLRDENAELNDQIIDTANEIKNLKLEQSLKPYNSALDESNSKIKSLQNNLDVLSIKFDNAYGSDKLEILKQQIELQKQLKEEQDKQLDALNKKENTLQDELSKNGFKFDGLGNITNMDAALKKLENTGSYEYVKSVLEQWKEVHEDEIPDAIKSIEDYEKAIQDSYNNQLNITKEIEDKITSMYKDQIDKRKEAIQKETDAVKKAMDEQKKAYQDARSEVEYKNDYTEKTDNIADLERQLEIAKKDNSLSNKKKIAELEKQLSDAKKDLDKFVQDKIDDDIINGFDKVSEETEEKNNEKIDELEKLWSDSKIAEMVAKALQTGVFEGIDGSVSNLQDAMLEFTETSGEAFGVLGTTIKESLVANLGIALDTLKNYSTVLDGLGLNNISTGLPTGDTSNKSVTTGDISINITTQSNANEKDIANEVKKAVNDALSGATQGL